MVMQLVQLPLGGLHGKWSCNSCNSLLEGCMGGFAVQLYDAAQLLIECNCVKADCAIAGLRLMVRMCSDRSSRGQGHLDRSD